MNDRPFTVRLSEEKYMELEKIAKQLGKTPAQLAREAILNHLNSDKPAEEFWLLSKPDGSSPEQLLTTKAA